VAKIRRIGIAAILFILATIVAARLILSSGPSVRLLAFELGKPYPYGTNGMVAWLELTNATRYPLTFFEGNRNPEHVCLYRRFEQWTELTNAWCCHAGAKIYLGASVIGDHTVRPGETYRFQVPVHLTNIPFKVAVECSRTNPISPVWRKVAYKCLPNRLAAKFAAPRKQVYLESEEILYRP